jgi:hypothetical protein
VAHRAQIDRDRARIALVDVDWLGQPQDGHLGEGWRRIIADLELPVRDGSGRPSGRPLWSTSVRSTRLPAA